MKSPRLIFAAALLFAVHAGCGARKKEITSIQRKQAATLASEAQFAMTLREYARAEGLLAKAAESCPDAGDYWIFLGNARMHLGQRDPAKTAYKGALAAFETVAAREPSNAQARLDQVAALAFLGRVDDARTLLRKTREGFPDGRSVRIYVDEQQLERMISDPQFKEVAL